MPKARIKRPKASLKFKKTSIISTLKYLSFLLTIIAAVILTIGFGYQQKNQAQPTILGASFSIKYAEELGIDWREAYMAALNDIGIKKFRLMSYWDTIEPQAGNYSFDDLDWQMDQAAKYDAKVSLAIGQRQPRWPECHIPSWTQPSNPDYGDQLLSYLEVIVERYKNHPALASYQLENEAANSHFGICPPLNRPLMQREFDLVRKLDPNTTLITNTSNQSGISIQQPVGDKIGFTIYRSAYYEALGQQRSWSFWYVPSQWHAFRAAISESLHDSQAFIHEMQAEPWGPDATINLSAEEQDISMNSKKLLDTVRFARETGMNEIHLWGTEWWYWRYTQFNDTELWSTVRNLYQDPESVL